MTLVMRVKHTEWFLCVYYYVYGERWHGHILAFYLTVCSGTAYNDINFSVNTNAVSKIHMHLYDTALLEFTGKGGLKLRLRKSFVVRLFSGLLVVFLILLTAGTLGVYAFARQSVGTEFIRLNQASLSQLAASAGRVLADARSFGETVSVNSKLLEIAASPDDSGKKQARSILVDQLSEFNTTHTNNNALMEAYVISSSGLNVSAYNSDHFTWESIQADSRCAPLLDGEVDMVLLPTTYNANERGIMIYSFQMVFAMRDLFSRESRGVVVLDLSELLLYNQYRGFATDDIRLAVMDSEGQILSDKNKKNIGEFYGYTSAQLAELSSNTQVSQRISDGQFLLYERIPGSEWLLVERMPTKVAFASLNQVRNETLSSILLCTVLAVVALVITAIHIFRRVMRIRDKMGEVITGDLTVRIPVDRDDEFGHIESAFNSMVEQIGHLIEAVRQSEQQKRAAEMDFLHAQINSHFIHNTLTSIRFMLEMDKVHEAGEMVFYFSKLLRQTLSRSSEFIPLRDEVDTLKSYVMLQHYRYQDAFEVAYDFPEDIMDVDVPTLILQPVVENAIFHGVGHSFTHIGISGHKEGQTLVLVVEDDGVGMSEQVQQSVLHKDVSLNHVGLRNIHDRIQLNYGQEYGLRVESQKGRGTKITFTLPIHGEGENEI